MVQVNHISLAFAIGSLSMVPLTASLSRSREEPSQAVVEIPSNLITIWLSNLGFTSAAARQTIGKNACCSQIDRAAVDNGQSEQYTKGRKFVTNTRDPLTGTPHGR